MRERGSTSVTIEEFIVHFFILAARGIVVVTTIGGLILGLLMRWLGFAATLLLPNAPAAAIIVATMATRNVGITKTPVSTRVILVTLTGMSMMPVVIAVSIVSLLSTSRLSLIHTQRGRTVGGAGIMQRLHEQPCCISSLNSPLPAIQNRSVVYRLTPASKEYETNTYGAVLHSVFCVFADRRCRCRLTQHRVHLFG